MLVLGDELSYIVTYTRRGFEEREGGRDTRGQCPPFTYYYYFYYYYYYYCFCCC